MAWSISIAPEGWALIRAELETWEQDQLIAAISDNWFEAVYGKADEAHASRATEAERGRLERLPHDILVDRAVELVEQNDTCGSGGCAYWIDREGYHRVHLPRAEDGQ